MGTYLNKRAKFDGNITHLHNILQKIWISDHAILQALIQKVLMVNQQIINIRNFCDAFHESVPIWLNLVDHEVLFEILNSVHHPLTKSESGAIKLSCTGSKFLGVVVGSPDSLKNVC